MIFIHGHTRQARPSLLQTKVIMMREMVRPDDERGHPFGGIPCAVRALCEKLAVLHHREFGKFRRLKGCH